MPASTAIANNLIRDVWRDNLEEEFEKIRQLIPTYNYVSIGCYKPGLFSVVVIMFQQVKEIPSHADEQYDANLRVWSDCSKMCNIRFKKIITT